MPALTTIPHLEFVPDAPGLVDITTRKFDRIVLAHCMVMRGLRPGDFVARGPMTRGTWSRVQRGLVVELETIHKTLKVISERTPLSFAS